MYHPSFKSATWKPFELFFRYSITNISSESSSSPPICERAPSKGPVISMLNHNQNQGDTSDSPLSSTSTAIPSNPPLKKEPFAFTPNELATLHDPKDLSVLRKMGGINGLVEGLRTDAINGLCPLEGMLGASENRTYPTLSQLNTRTSLHGDHLDVPSSSHRHTLSLSISPPIQTFQDRRKVFGTNRIPPKKSKNLFQLMWMVLQDKLLVSSLDVNSYARYF